MDDRQHQLWQRYRGGEEPSPARENLILHYAPEVKVLAGRLHSRLPAHVDVADLIAAGLTGLLEAIERYDPERGIKFESFARPRIHGAMVDALRALDWVPRKVRNNAREIEAVESSQRAKLRRSPTEQEVADGLEIEVFALRRNLLEIHRSQLYSVDAPRLARGSGESGGETAILDLTPSDVFRDPQEDLEASESAAGLRIVLGDAIGGLPEGEQFVLLCRYRESLRFGEIAEVMGLSESRVWQLHTKALVGLRAAVGIDHAGQLHLARR